MQGKSHSTDFLLKMTGNLEMESETSKRYRVGVPVPNRERARKPHQRQPLQHIGLSMLQSRIDHVNPVKLWQGGTYCGQRMDRQQGVR